MFEDEATALVDAGAQAIAVREQTADSRIGEALDMSGEVAVDTDIMVRSCILSPETR